MKISPVIPETEIIGCYSESGVTYCIEDNCVYQKSNSDCLDYRLRHLKIIIGERDIMEHIRQVELAFRKYKLLKSNVYQVPEQKFIPAYLSKKLYERCIKNSHPHTSPANRNRMNNILSLQYQLTWATYIRLGKYTIVELEYNGKHYHGLAALAPCDEMMTSAGIAVAYRRAFESMIEDTR